LSLTNSIPDAHGAVPCRGRDLGAIGAESRIINIAGMTAQHSTAFDDSDVPKQDRLIVAGTGQARAIRAEGCSATSNSLIAVQHAQRLPGLGIPQPNGHIIAASHQLRAPGLEGSFGHSSPML
jgi:hypothetical protein